LFLLVAILFIPVPARAAETFAGSDGLPEPRVATPDLKLPEESMSVEVQAAMASERNQPVHDDSGRIHYIVDLTDNVTNGYSDKTPVDARLGDWHKPAMYGVTHAFEARYKFQATGMTSWVGNGFAAYLTPAQVKALKHDPQVVRVTEDHEEELSAVWADQPLTGSEKMPWNIVAVGGGKQLYAGSVRAYVLDVGVGYHNDLTNIVSRVSADPLANVVGCYPHATHVAGILSAAQNGAGVVGVDLSVPVVSVSAADSNKNNQTYNCGYGSPDSYIDTGLDKIKALISAGGRVGIINISLNPQDNALSNPFASTALLGQKLLSVATPAPGYPGAFIVQSAGNYAKDACVSAYDAHANNDGIMVVGAVDINGQPVVDLNGINGFRNRALLGAVTGATQPGSNFGPCVDTWAPGNSIYSTWADWDSIANFIAITPNVRQSGNYTYSKYGQMSGTSMAAPHVAGVAAWLAEIGGLTTPAQIETAVRNYAYSSGAKDPATGMLLRMANAEGASYTAQPTAEFAINGVVNGNRNTNSATPFTLSYDSVGAQSCDLTGYLNNAVWYQNLNFNTAFDWGTVQLVPGNYRWVVNCRSAANTMNSAQATATVTLPPPSPTVAFSFNNVPQPNVAWTGPTNPWPSTAAGIKEIPYGMQPFNFSYNTTASTSSCQLSAFYATTIRDTWTPWYSVADMPTYYGWPPVTLDRNYYWWWLTCTGTGGTVAVNFYAHVY
jgi:hypothetical protein